MEEKDTEQMENQEELNSSDPWAQAFAAVNKEEEEASETTTDSTQPTNDDNDTEGTNEDKDSNESEMGDSSELSESAGAVDNTGGTDSQSYAGALDDLFSFTEEEVTEYKDSLQEKVEKQALQDVANAYIKKGARHTNGKLGATINDPDICKRDSDGVPSFYNPDTGREFRGDNPRRQAQEWVDDYNKELANAFNKTCEDYSKKLLEEQGLGLAVIDFAPKYSQLDPIRKAMFESIIEDYEVTDKDGDLIGYSCDLDKALAAVNRQVRTMQNRFKSMASEENKTSGPALDMKSKSKSKSGKAKASHPEFKSIAEAMEYQQDQLLKKMDRR